MPNGRRLLGAGLNASSMATLCSVCQGSSSRLLLGILHLLLQNQAPAVWTGSLQLGAESDCRGLLIPVGGGTPRRGSAAPFRQLSHAQRRWHHGDVALGYSLHLHQCL